MSFRVLYGILVLAHERKRVVHFNVTEHPTAEWTAEQLVQAFPLHRFHLTQTARGWEATVILDI